MADDAPQVPQIHGQVAGEATGLGIEFPGTVLNVLLCNDGKAFARRRDATDWALLDIPPEVVEVMREATKAAIEQYNEYHAWAKARVDEVEHELARLSSQPSGSN